MPDKKGTRCGLGQPGQMMFPTSKPDISEKIRVFVSSCLPAFGVRVGSAKGAGSCLRRCRKVN